METQRAVRAVVIPVLAFATVILCAVAFGMFLHVVPHGTAPLFALLATLAVMFGAFVVSSRGTSRA